MSGFAQPTSARAGGRAEDWKRLRELFHPEARIGVFAGGGARSQVFETEATALEAYRRLGIDLGVFSWP